MDITQLLKIASEKHASDVFITANAPVSAKIDGDIMPLTSNSLTAEQSSKLVHSLMEDRIAEEFHEQLEANFAYVLNKDVRFRVNAYMQRDHVGCVMRKIETVIPSLEELGLPDILKQLVMHKRGLVFFVGATSTGKSTSLAAMIGYRNQNSKGHIITIEDPIEFIHEHDKSLVMQREVGSDTHNFGNALRNTLRQAPDVIMIGEVRSAEAMQHAMTFAETGHLVLSTLHANNANQAIERILHFFPEERHKQVMLDLSLNLHAIVAQRLIKKPRGGYKVILEILLGTPRIADLIKRGEIDELKEAMKKSDTQGMMTFDQALVKAVHANEISIEAALENSDSVNEVRLALKLSEHEQLTEKTEAHPHDDGVTQNSSSRANLGSLQDVKMQSLSDKDEPRKGTLTV